MSQTSSQSSTTRVTTFKESFRKMDPYLRVFSAVVSRGGSNSTTHFHGDLIAELAERPQDQEEVTTVPPAVMRSLRNIRREVVVDIEGRNVVR